MTRAKAERSTWCSAVVRIPASVGLFLHAATLVLYVPSGLVAPPAGVALLYIAWLLASALGIHWRRRYRHRVLLLPLASVALWASVVAAGDAYFGWIG